MKLSLIVAVTIAVLLVVLFTRKNSADKFSTYTAYPVKTVTTDASGASISVFSPVSTIRF